MHSPDGKTHSPRPNESKKATKKPTSLKEAARQVQQDQINLQVRRESFSPKRGLNKKKEDNQATSPSPKKITQEAPSLENQKEQRIIETEEDNNINTNTDISLKGTNRYQGSDSVIDPEQQVQSLM